MTLTPAQKRLVEKIVNVFETGSPDGDYGNISIYADGPHGVRQITYGRSQTTEFGNLRDLVVRYIAAKSTYSAALAPYVDRIGADPGLVDDLAFRKLLRDAGRMDPAMQATQDRFFDDRYFKPAMAWARKNGFVDPLSALVIYDSFIHSGSIIWTLRSKFPDNVPAAGGSERAWTTAYVKARHQWLATHPRPILHATVYRTKCFAAEIKRGNWNLAQVPVKANGTPVS